MHIIISSKGYPIIDGPSNSKPDEASQRIQQDIMTITQKIAEFSGEGKSTSVSTQSSPFVTGIRQIAEAERKVCI